MTRIALPLPIFSPRLTTLPEGSVTVHAASAEARTDLPFTVATLLDVEASTSHSHAGEAAAVVKRAAARRRCCCCCCFLALPRSRVGLAGDCKRAKKG